MQPRQFYQMFDGCWTNKQIKANESQGLYTFEDAASSISWKKCFKKGLLIHKVASCNKLLLLSCGTLYPYRLN